MSHYRNQELPPARIEIRIDDHNLEAKKRYELPFNLLVLADFFKNSAHLGNLKNRTALKVDRYSLDEALNRFRPNLSFVVNEKNAENQERIIDLTFRAMHDFHPDAIVEQIPFLRRLLAMRNLLKELKSNLLNEPEQRILMDKILQDPKKVMSLCQELDCLKPEQVETFDDNA